MTSRRRPTAESVRSERIQVLVQLQSAALHPRSCGSIERRRAVTHVDSVRTLLLTQGYEPIQIISWQRAITLIALDKVEVVEEYDTPLLRAQSIVINVPAVVRLRKTFRRHAKLVKFSRVNIYARDNYRCQYCALKCTTDELTYDHVVPRSKGGRTTWDNIVSACYLC